MSKPLDPSRHLANSRTLVARAAAVVCLGTCLPVMALAQAQAQAEPAEQSAGVLEKDKPGDGAKERNQLQAVVVTANRRKEMARDVPLQINRLSADELEQSGAKGLVDYLAGLPAVDVKTQGGAGLGAISVRGVSTGDQTIATVGTYIDDIAVGSYSPFVSGPINALDMALLDLSHIELLRGPQGTLYGAGAMGGVLKYVTNEPNTKSFESWARVAVQSTDGGSLGHTVSGLINVPVQSGVSAVRVAAFSDKDPGYVTAVGPAGGAGVNKGDSQGIRVVGLLEPSKDFKLRLSAVAQDLHRDGLDYVDYDPVTRTPKTSPSTRSLAMREPYTSKIRVYSAELEADLGFARLNSTTSAQRIDLTSAFDTTPVYGPLLSELAGLNVASVPQNVATVLRKTTQEFRLSSDAKKEVSWLGGLYYDRETGTNDQSISTVMPDGSQGPDIIRASLPSKFEEFAAFADVTWNPTSQWSITGGARVSRNRQTYRQVGGGLIAAPTDLSSESSETTATYLLTGKYALSPTSNVYVRAASGYRPGGPNVVLLDPATGLPAAPASFKSDSLWSYEGGYKADLLDQTLSVQATVYQIRWRNIQQYYAVQGLNLLTNAGKAKIDGAEASLTLRVSPDWTVATSLAYTDGRLTESGPGIGVEGAQLPNQAKWSFGLSSRYEFSVGEHQGYVGAAVRGVGHRDAGFAGSASLPSYRLPGYALADAQAGMKMGRFDLGLSIRNLFDRRTQMSAQTNFVPLGSPAYVVEARPRTVTLSVTAAY
ncbi:TonB-dependent receptor [Roseateles sp. P5_D6]